MLLTASLRVQSSARIAGFFPVADGDGRARFGKSAVDPARTSAGKESVQWLGTADIFLAIDSLRIDDVADVAPVGNPAFARRCRAAVCPVASVPCPPLYPTLLRRRSSTPSSESRSL
jgi:hypothetical protein